MTAVLIRLSGYETEAKPLGIEVDQYEGLVHLDTRSLTHETDQPSLTAEEARALAAALIHAASETTV